MKLYLHSHSLVLLMCKTLQLGHLIRVTSAGFLTQNALHQMCKKTRHRTLVHAVVKNC